MHNLEFFITIALQGKDIEINYTQQYHRVLAACNLPQ